MAKIPFIKYQGTGNDFVLIDLRRVSLSLDFSSFARRVCERRWGIGADGLLLLFPSSIADCRMCIFNADGSEPSMCGNGIRCVLDYLHKREGLSEMKIETLSGVLKGRKAEDAIAVNLGSPSIIHWPLLLEEGPAYIIDTGVPHAVLFVDDLNDIDVDFLGRKIRNDAIFAPQGVNVNFASVNAEGKVTLRTYERGVEGETLACGTGAAATAYAALHQAKLSQPISILTRCSFQTNSIQYQEQIRFFFPKNPHGQLEIEMLGPASEVFQGSLDL